MSNASGSEYAPRGRPAPACDPGELVFAAVGLDHGHINGMCNGLTEAGAELRWAYDPDPVRLSAFLERHPGVRAARSPAEVLDDADVGLVASARVPADHAPFGLEVLASGRDYFTDKPALTTLEQLEAVRAACAGTGRRYAVYFSERVHVESAVYAGELVAAGAIGRVVHVLGLGPHRPDLASRPPWFFQRERYGGILCDIGSHQVEQFLHFTGNETAEVVTSRVANFAHEQHPGLEDFGDCALAGPNGAAGYFRVDWFTPAGLGAWGDGRTVLLGTEGYIELRKYIDVARSPQGDHVFLVDGTGEHHMEVAGRVGYPFFGQLVRDCIDRTQTSMTQEHILEAARLCVVAEQQATRLDRAGEAGGRP